MDRFEILSGDFLKNAGIVGIKYLLDISDAIENRDYGISEDNQAFWIEKEFALNADWTDMYFQASVRYFGESTVYQTVLEKIQINLKKLEEETWKPDKTEKEDLKFINDKLLSNSYQAGFENIKNKISHPEIYNKLKKEKLKDKMSLNELEGRLRELYDFLIQPLCRETFCMKSIVYNYINRFWDGKCFLLRANAKKDMKELFEKEFVIPLKQFWSKDHSKSKELCIECANPMDSKEKVSIAFMKEMADDLARKKSAFWNCKVDAFLCPVCTFLYALSPLGFQLIGDKFLFVNTNKNVKELIGNNRKNSRIEQEKEKQDNEKYPAWFARIMNTVLSEKTRELGNIQIILRGTKAEDRYLFSIIHKDVLKILNDNKIRYFLNRLGKHPITKIGSEYINVYETVVLNILQYKKQYIILNRLLKVSIENEGIMGISYLVYAVQLQSNLIRNGNEGGIMFSNKMNMRNSGYALRKALLESRGMTTDECLRGTIYQLLNALSVKNEEKFMEIILRTYCSSKLLVPNEFVYMLGNQELFLEYGYAFVLGLKGSHQGETNKNNFEDNKNNEQEEIN